jgi:hypothetical protein
MIKIIDQIPDYKPHCGNCKYFTPSKKQEAFGICDLDYEPDTTPSWGWCPAWEERSK